MHDLNITIPVAIHLDHGSSFEKCKEAIDAGFTYLIQLLQKHLFHERIQQLF
jgi:fructose-bisphosphate aldolase class II